MALKSPRGKDDLQWVSTPEGFMVKKQEGVEAFTVNADFLVSAVNKNLAKTLIELPVAKDLPRLLRGFEITLVGPPEILVFKEDPELPKAESIKQVITFLARYIDGEQAATEVSGLLEVLRPDKDIQVELTKLVQSGVFNEKRFNFLASLKAVQQELVYPAVMELRRGIYMNDKNEEKFPYKDVKGTWKIRIHIDPYAVTVIHHKWEICRYDKFKFHWFFEVRRATDGTRTAALRIINYSFADNLGEEEKIQIYKALRPYLATTAEYNALWSKPNSAWSLKHDIVSLTDRLTLTDQFGTALYKKEKDESTPNSAKRFLTLIATYFEPPTIELIESGFNQHVKPTGDLAEQLDRVLTPEFQQQAPRLIRMLKLLSHDMLYYGTHRLRDIVHTQMPYQDVKGSYRVHVQMTITERKNSTGKRLSVTPGSMTNSPTAAASSSKPMTPGGLASNVPAVNSKVSFVVVTHRKLQKGSSPAPKDGFRFEWIVALKSRRSLEELYSADFRVLDVRYSPETMPAVKTQLDALIQPLYIPRQVGDTVCNVSVDQLIESLAKQAGEETVFIESIAHSIPTRVALLALQRALREKNQEGLRVMWK